MNKIIEGVGVDAEIVTNSNGGKQSKSPSALYLVDPNFIAFTFAGEDNNYVEAVLHVCDYMSEGCMSLFQAILCIEPDRITALLEIGKVLQYGAERYSPNNWRLIPREEHLNHALIHLVALLAGDTQDDHREHAMCRLHMAIATEETKGFSYTKPFNEKV